MYARNNATPRPITVGPVVQISDGAVQTSGASVEVSKDGGSFTAGGGTLAVSNGIHSYTPTQGETDCDSLRINVYKTGCIPATAQAVFSASATFGYAGTDQSKIANVSSTQNLSGTTIKAVTDGVTVTTNNDKTGYSLTQAFPSNFSALAITAGGAVTVGANNDKTGYALTQAFPSNFAALGINGSGHISRVTLVDTTTTNTDMRGTNNAALASNWTATRAGYLDSVLIAANSNRTVQVTGSHHVAADIHELQPAVIDSTRFAAGAIDSNALAASAATEIATAVGALTQLVDLTTMIVNDGTANARFSTSALQNAPTGGGGSSTVNVLPYTGAVPDRVEGTTIKVFYNELTNVSVGVTDSAGSAVDVSAKTLRFIVEDRFGNDILTIDDASITKVTSTFTIQIPQSMTDTIGANYKWALRDLTSSLNTVLMHGQIIVAEAAEDEV
jgi:hypothetical protein